MCIFLINQSINQSINQREGTTDQCMCKLERQSFSYFVYYAPVYSGKSIQAHSPYPSLAAQFGRENLSLRYHRIYTCWVSHRRSNLFTGLDKLSTRIWLFNQQWNWVDDIIACTFEPRNYPKVKRDKLTHTQKTTNQPIPNCNQPMPNQPIEQSTNQSNNITSSNNPNHSL